MLIHPSFDALHISTKVVNISTMLRLLAFVAIAALVNTSNFPCPRIFVLADDLQKQDVDGRPSRLSAVNSSSNQGIKVNYEKEGSIFIHGDEVELTSSDADHYDNDKKMSPSLKVHPISFDLSESSDEGFIHIKMPNGSSKKMKNVVTVPREALGGNREISKAYWYGEDASDGSTFNYIRGVDGSIHGSLVDQTTNTVSQLRIDPQGNQIAVTRLSDDFPEEDDAEAPFTPNFEEHLFPISDHRKLNSNDDKGMVTDDSGKVLDIMVVWTEKAEITAGGASSMQSTINLAIEETNVGKQFYACYFSLIFTFNIFQMIVSFIR